MDSLRAGSRSPRFIVPVMMSSAVVPVENISGIVKAIPGAGENRLPSRRNRCSPSSRNAFHVHPEILLSFARNPHADYEADATRESGGCVFRRPIPLDISPATADHSFGSC
jgi:hypothetical protein